MKTTPVWLRLVLLLYPRAFRSAHGAEVAEFVAIERGRLRGASFVARAAFVLRMTRDLAAGAVRARAGSPGRSNGPLRRRGGNSVLREAGMALRSLRRAPGFTVIVVATLAIGIGLGTSIFSALNAVLLRPLAYDAPDRLVRVTAGLSGAEDVSLAGGTLTKLRERTRAFADLAGIATIRQNLTGTALPRQVEVGWTTPNLFALLGVQAAVGRTFGPDDPMGTALLSYGTWERDFGSDPGIVGRGIRLDGFGYTVVGVLPRGFELHLGRVPRDINVWKVPDPWWQNGDIWSSEGSEFGLLRVVGRLAPAADLTAARADLGRMADGLKEEVPSYRTENLRLGAEPLQAYVVAGARPILVLLMAAVVLVVLIACANVAGLLLVRAEDRRHDIAVRLALGSGPGRVFAHVLAESALLAIAGGALGLGLGLLGTRLLPLVAPADVPRLADVSIDGRVLAFAALLTMLCTLLVGLAPAVGAMRRSPRSVLTGARATGGAFRGGARRTLVVAQVGVSLVLVICAGLLAGSLGRLERVDPGIDADGVLTFAVSVPGARYGWPEETDLFFRRLEERLRALPGVISAGVVWPLPLTTRWDGAFHGGAVREEDRHLVRYELATESYFETLGIDVEGRTFGTHDPKRGVLVSRALADRAWPGTDPIGRTLRALPWGQDTVPFEVIGIAGNVRYTSLRDAPTEVVYFDSRGYAWTDWEVDFVVRARGDLAALGPLIRAEVASLDAEIPVAGLRPLSALVEEELATNRFARLVFAVFAAVAALLALLGLYGVISYGVRRRRHEFGIRMALGSGATSILALVVRQGVLMAGAGVGLGLLGALWAARTLEGLLFGVSAHEPWIFTVAAAAMALVALVASVLPARRAARLDPALVLRSD